MQPYIGTEDTGEPARLEAQAAGVREELRAALALHPVPAGTRVLELGCGGGVFTRALAAALPDAAILATDRDERLLAHARRALAKEVAAGRVRFERADAATLPYPAQSFDLAACRCLLMHQADPLVVVAEMFRALEVGGVALALEPDWGARALYPDSKALAALLDLAQRARSYGFPDLLLGRTLYALFRAAGFAAVHIAASSFVETAGDRAADAERESDVTGPARLLAQGRMLLRSAGLADDATLDALIARLEAAPRHPEYFSAGLDFAAVGRKPAPSLDPAAW
jgi:SAM-dependent methyltransferase